MIFGAAGSRRPPRAPRESRRTTPRAAPTQELPPKLIPVLRAMMSTTGSLIHTRLSLAGIELEEELQRFISAAALGVVAVVFVLLALVVGTFTVVAAVPPEHRVGTMIGITVLYLLIAVIAVKRVQGIFANRPPIFSATLAEIEKDKETLAQMSRAHRAADAAHARRTEEDTFATVRPATDRGL